MTAVDTERLVVDETAVAEARARLEGQGARLLSMTMVDNAGVTRVKIVPLKRLESVARNGVGMSSLWAVSGSDDHFAPVAPFDTPSGDMRLIPDASAARLLPSSPGYAWAPVDQYDQELRVEPACQRSVLKRVLDEAHAQGIEFRTTFETEMTLLNLDGTPAHVGPGYSPRALLPLEPFALELVDALDGAGIEVEQLHPEYSPGQFEVSVAPRDPLAAADELVLLRVVARQVARNHGFDVSFSPVVIPGAAGNGAHFHLSAWRDGENLMQGGGEHGGMQAEGAAIVAGVLEELVNVLALLAPVAPGYGRLQPHHWAGAYACWGIENREAALRFIPGTVTSRARSANLEVKTLDAAANPYLASAALLAAGLQGLARAASLPAPLQEDPGNLSDAGRAQLGIERLPSDLGKATERLAASAHAKAVLGETLHRAVVAVRELEWETAGGKDPDELAPSYRFRF